MIDSPIALSARNLVKRYGALIAVNDICLDLKSGEAVGLLGPNGAGKTTTLSMMIGLIQPDQGMVRLGEHGNPCESAVRQQIGFAPQKLSLYEELTGRENLAFFGSLYRLAGSHLTERVNWCLEFAGLKDRANSRVATYSGGMQRRLNLACALIHEPKLVLLDEPTVGVDPQSRNHLLESIERLKNEGLTVLYTTHYMEEAQRLCDRVAVIDKGRILANAPVAELLEQFGGQSLVVGQMARIPDSSVELPAASDGLSLRFYSTQPFKEIGKLNAQGVEFQKLEIRAPDLESVFLKLTGKSLRD